MNHRPVFAYPGSKFVPVLALLAAVFLRLYLLPALPPGLNFDEAGNGVAALDILHAAPKIWWQIGGGKEPLWPYLIAVGTAVWGNIPFTLRLAAALVGILTVAAMYPLAYCLYRGPNRRAAVAIAGLAMAGLALSEWHLHFSRLGFRAILLPLLSGLSFYFLWRAISLPAPRSNSFDLPLAALFMALSMYAYLAGRLLPLVPALFLAVQYLASRVRGQKLSPARGHFQAGWRFVAWLLLFLLPLILYFLLHPADLAARSAAVSIFNPAWNQGDLAGTAWHTLVTTLGTFLGLSGDANPLVNLPGQPAVPPVLAVFFGLGLAVSLFKAFSAPGKGAPAHLFVLCWWVVMLLPAVLAPEGAPHHLRLIGAIIPTYLMVAVGLNTAAGLLGRLLPAAARPLLLLPVACYLLVGIQTYSHYFITWPERVDFTLPFDLYAVRLANDVTRTPPGAAYILPMDIRARSEARHYTLDYLAAGVQPVPYTYLPVDEQNAETILTRAAAGNTRLYVVRWTADKHHQADEKEIVTFLLARQARLVDRASFPVYDVETYALPDTRTTFTLPSINRPNGAVFDGLLRLDAVFVQPYISPGGTVPVALTLLPLAPAPVDYKASVRVISPTGERIAQKDRMLRHNFHQGTSLWPPGESVNEYYLLPLPSDALPGDYTVALVIYHPGTQAPLTANGQVEVPLATIRVQ